MLRRHEPTPLYFQLETLLRELIEAGDFEPGSSLPSEMELARQHRVSRVTVREALRRLEEDGLVVRQRGRGTFVAPGMARTGKITRDLANVAGFDAEVRRLGYEPEGEVLAIEELPASGRLAEVMHVPAGTPLLRIRRRGTSRGEPLWLEARYFPAEIGRGLVASGELSSPAVVRLLEKQISEKVGTVRVELDAAVATERQAQLLRVARGSAVQIYEAVAETESGRLVQLIRVVFPSGRFRFAFCVTRESVMYQAPLLLADGVPLPREAMPEHVVG